MLFFLSRTRFFSFDFFAKTHLNVIFDQGSSAFKFKKIFQQFNALINSNIDLNGPSKELPPPAVKECTTKLLAEHLTKIAT